jgi:hypothetical protein
VAVIPASADSPAVLCPRGDAMDDAKRLAGIDTKLKRINGKAELNGKLWRYLAALVGERESIINPNWSEELKQMFEELRTKSVESD